MTANRKKKVVDVYYLYLFFAGEDPLRVSQGNPDQSTTICPQNRHNRPCLPTEGLSPTEKAPPPYSAEGLRILIISPCLVPEWYAI
jgi:hypothetical protein